MTAPTSLTSYLARKWRCDVDTGTNTAAGTMADDTFTLTGHGLTTGQTVNVTSGPAPITADTTYYVVNADANTFQLSATAGGAPVDLTADGDLMFGGWVQVRGVTNFTPGISPTMQSTDDYDSDGWGSDEKTMLKWNLAIALIRKGADEATPDPGQEALRVKSDLFGSAGTATVRWYDRNGGPEAYEGDANVSWEPSGGSTSDVENVTVNLTGKGARRTIANPAAV